MKTTLPVTIQKDDPFPAKEPAMNLVQDYRSENARRKPESMQNWCRYGELLEILVRVMVLSRGRTSLRSLIENWSVENVARVAGKSAASQIRPKGKCRW